MNFAPYSETGGQSATSMGGRAPKVCCSLIGQKNTNVFWHQWEARTAATVWNRSGKTMFPGARAWKLLSRLFFRPNWLPFGLRGWFHCGIRLHLLCTAVPSPQTKSGRGTSVSYRLSPWFPFSGRGSCTQATTMIGSYIVFTKVWQIVDHRERPASVLKTDAKCGWMDKKTLARFFFPLSFDNDQ